MNEKGNSSLLVIVIVFLVLIVVASGISYYILQSQGKAPVYMSPDNINYTTNMEYATSPTYGVSEDDEVVTLESELENTSSGDIDNDIYDLNSSASSL